MSNLIEKKREMRFIYRFAGTPCIKPQNDIEHCFITGEIFKQLCVNNNKKWSNEELEFVYNHDLLEIKTGDLLYHSKNLNSKTVKAWEDIEWEIIYADNESEKLAPYNEQWAIKHIFKDKDMWELFRIADMIELWQYVSEEISLGNNHPKILSAQAFARSWLTSKKEDGWKLL